MEGDQPQSVSDKAPEEVFRRPESELSLSLKEKESGGAPDSGDLFDEPVARWYLDDLDRLLVWAVDRRASDIAINPNDTAWVRIHGKWRRCTRRPFTTDEIEMILNEMARTSAATARIKGANDLDFSHEVKVARFRSVRFRCNATGIRVGWSFGVSLVLRVVPAMPPALSELDVEDSILQNAFPENGLVLVTGVMGSGKSTLLSSILRHIRENYQRHILTYESPIEFDLSTIDNPKGPCTQTEIPEHLRAFEIAPRNSARRAADVILVGESRDQETLRGMIEAAEIGVAAYSTVHTRSVAETPSRIINVFPADLQNQMATTLANSLRLIVQQRLLPAVGGGRIAIREILAFDQNARETLARTPVHELTTVVQKMVVKNGQHMFDDAKKKFEDGRISKEVFNMMRHEFV